MKKIILLAVLLSSAAIFAEPYQQMWVIRRTQNTVGTGTPNSCHLELAAYDLNYAIEWRVSETSPEWMITNPNSGFRITVGGDSFTNCRRLTSCTVHGDRDPATFIDSSLATTYIDDKGITHSFKPNVSYYFAARQFIDSNKNGTQDPGEFVREWSNPVPSMNGDYNHSCTFNMFPAQ